MCITDGKFKTMTCVTSRERGIIRASIQVSFSLYYDRGDHPGKRLCDVVIPLKAEESEKAKERRLHQKAWNDLVGYFDGDADTEENIFIDEVHAEDPASAKFNRAIDIIEVEFKGCADDSYNPSMQFHEAELQEFLKAG